MIAVSSLETLQALVPPPTAERSTPDWAVIEEQLGIRLPDDYKHLVEVYGPGSFDGFLWVLQPLYSNEHLDLLRQRDIRLAALREAQEHGEAVPFPVHDGQDPLLPWAITDNGDVCYWLRDSLNDPNSWAVAVNEARGDAWHKFEGSASDFLAAVLSGSSRVALFPADFPSEAPTFEAESA